MATMPVRSLREYLDEGEIAPSEADTGPESFANRQKGDGMGPIEDWSDDLLALAVKQNRPEAIAEQARRTGFVSTASPAPSLPMPANALKADATAPNLGVNNRLRGLDASRSEPATVAESPSPIAAPPLVRPKGETKRPAPSFPEYAAPSFTLEAIPTASAPPTGNAVTPVVSTQLPVTSTSPAGKPDSAGTQGLPAPSSEGAGGDTSERDLYLARLAAQSAAGFGGMGAGKNIDMGIADTLGERLKQVQALRAKREEQSLEQQRERATWGTSNRSTLASALAQWKGDEAKTAALEALASGADTTKPSEFSRNVVNAVMTKPKVLGAEAGVAKTVAQADVAKQAPGFKEREVVVKEDTLAERERANKANEEIRRQALLLKKASDTKTADEVRSAGSDPKAAERAITRAMETAESDKLGIAGNIRDFQGLEKVAPGFTRGKVPSWLGQGSIEAASKVPALSKQASELASALETFIAGIRKSLFGASLTGNEKASFDAIVSSGLLMPPEVLAANINRLREGAAKFAQNHFTVAQELHPEVTGRVLRASSLFGPATREGGVYADVWRVQAPPTAAGGRPEKPTLAAGKTALWDVANGKWVSAPDAQVDAAVASGKYEK